MDKKTFHISLIRTMVCVSASNGTMHDAEFKRIGDIVACLPAFKGFKPEKIASLAGDCARAVNERGLKSVLDGIIVSISQHVNETGSPILWETAYAMACDVAVADGSIDASERKMLMLLADEFRLDALTAAAIERGSQARFAC